MQAGGERPGLAREVTERDHPDAPGLAPRAGLEGDRPRGGDRLAERGHDRGQLGARAVTEEGERDVEHLARKQPAALEVLVPPPLEDVERRIGELEATREARAGEAAAG